MWLSRLRTQLVFTRMRVQSLASFSGLRIRCGCKLQCRLQMLLRSGIAVAVGVAGSCSSNSTPSLGTSICFGFSHKKEKKKKNRKEAAHIHLSGLPASNRWRPPASLPLTRGYEVWQRVAWLRRSFKDLQMVHLKGSCPLSRRMPPGAIPHLPLSTPNSSV